MAAAAAAAAIIVTWKIRNGYGSLLGAFGIIDFMFCTH